MKDQRGFAAILMVSIVLVMIVTFMGSAAVYFGSLYKEIARQQRAIAAHTATEDFAKMIQKARENWLAYRPGSPCPSATMIEDGVRQLCWPRPTGAAPFVHCIPHPMGGSNAGNPNATANNPARICRSGAGFTTPASMTGEMEVVFQAVPPTYQNYPSMINDYIYAFKRDFKMGLDILASRIQNAAEAQTSEAAHMPNLAGALGSRFSTALACPAPNVAVPPALRPYCKVCPGVGGSNLDSCIRIRICLKPSGCASDADWVNRTIGLLGRD